MGTFKEVSFLLTLWKQTFMLIT